MFTTGTRDIEGAQFQILAAAQSLEKQFRRNRLYPDLANLIDVVSSLTTIIDNREQYQTKLPKKLSGVDFENKTLKFDAIEADAEDVAQMFELIEWAMPQLKSLATEGMAMFDFVQQNMSVNVVGILPVYRDEGYAFIPDHPNGMLHVIRYQMSIYTDEKDQYRAMKTEEVEQITLGQIHSAPESLKMSLVTKREDLPNPATYIVDTDLEFPYEETIMPIAKRALLRELASN